MTKQLKKIVLFAFFGVLIFSFFNCEYDEKETSKNLEKHHSHEKVSRISRNQITSNKKIVEKLLHVNNAIESNKNNKNNKNNRSIYSSEFDFYIDTDFATYIENEEATYHSYTFLITRTNPTSNLENLVFSLNSQGEYDALIIIYNLNAQEKSLLEDGETIDLTGKVTSQRIDGASLQNDIFNKESATSGNCEGYVVTQSAPYCGCNEEAHATDLTGCQCVEFDYDREYFGCSGYGGTTTTGTTGDSSSPPSGDGSTGSNTTNESDPVITYPTTTCPDCAEIDEDGNTNDPCTNLKELSNPLKQNIDPSITALKNKLAIGVTKEWGVSFKSVLDSVPPIYTNNLYSGNSNTADFYKGWDYRGGAHLHTTKGYGMFSWGDVNNLYGAYDYIRPSDRPNVVNIIVCDNYSPITSSDPYNVYAIKIDNPSLLSTELNNVLNDPAFYVAPSGNIQKDYEDKLNKIHKNQDRLFNKSIKNNPSLGMSEALEKAFLQQFANYGISLYKKNNATNNWEKLTLNSFTNNVLSTPCN